MADSHNPVPGRKGYTILEVVAATALMAVVMVPALTLMRDSLELGNSIDMATRSIWQT